jgi:hypothetical protein
VPAVPAVAVVRGNTLYGALVEVVVFGIVSPVSAATTSSPHEAEDRITRNAFVAFDPPVDHANCKEQPTVSVQALLCAFGPSSVNIPTVKLYFCTSPPGE